VTIPSSSQPSDSDPEKAPTWLRRAVPIVVGTALACGAAVALVVLLTGGGVSLPALPPKPEVRVPSRNTPSSPPWGFTGSGWTDLCYLPVPADAHPLRSVPDSQPCPSGSQRFTGLTQIALTAGAGADVDRLGTTWGTIQPLPPAEAAARGEPRFRWAPLMRRYHAILRDGIRPVVVAYGTPAWARIPGWERPGMCGLPAGGCAFPPAPRHLPAWRAFVRGLMTHMPQMRALEVWNEPNSARFFAPHPEPALYARMLRAVDEAARQVHFERPIITGGLAPDSPVNAGKMLPAEYLTRVYEIAGQDAFDGIGAHPYPDGPPWTANMTANLDQLRSVSARFGDRSKPIWITEVGLGGTPSGAGTFNVPLDRQGPILARMYRAVQGTSVRSFIIFALNDTGIPRNRFGVYGVLTPTLQPKPAYCYLAEQLGQTHPCPPGAR